MKSACFVVTSDQSAVFLRGYLGHLRQHGWDVSLIANDDGRLEEVGRREGIKVVAIPMFREPSPLRDLVSLIRMIITIRRIRPDALIYSTPKAALLGALAGWMLRVPVRLYELWGLRHETENGPRRVLLLAFERLIGRLSSEVVADSESLARLAEHEGIARRVTTLGSGSALGVDTARFDADSADIGPVDPATRAFLDEHPDVPRVLFVGRINRDKGVDTLIEAVRALAESGRSVATIVVGGAEDPLLEAELRRAAETLAIRYVGGVGDPRPYMAVADFLCLPTLREGFGQVIIEAAAMGLPAVTTTATGARDAVVNEVTGLLVAPRDHAALAEAIWRLGEGAELTSTLGKSAKTRAVTEFDVSVVWPRHREHLVNRSERAGVR